MNRTNKINLTRLKTTFEQKAQQSREQGHRFDISKSSVALKVFRAVWIFRNVPNELQYTQKLLADTEGVPEGAFSEILNQMKQERGLIITETLATKGNPMRYKINMNELKQFIWKLALFYRFVGGLPNTINPKIMLDETERKRHSAEITYNLVNDAPDFIEFFESKPAEEIIEGIIDKNIFLASNFLNLTDIILNNLLHAEALEKSPAKSKLADYKKFERAKAFLEKHWIMPLQESINPLIVKAYT